MNLRGIDLNLLPVFEAIYVARSLARASQALHITPPAVSNALSRLRAHFDDPLFVREGRGIVPTPAAEALIPSVRAALDQLRTGLELKSNFDPATSARVFNVSVRDIGALLITGELAHTLERDAANVRVHFSQVDRAAIAAELASGRLDLAIDSAELRGADIAHEVVHTDRYVCVLRKGHACAKAKLTLKRYLGLRHVTVSSRRVGRTSVEDAVRRLGARLTPVARLPHYLGAFEMVRSSNCVLAAPSFIVNGQDLCVRPLPFEVPALEVRVYFRRASGSDAGLRWLRQAIAAAASTATARAPKVRRSSGDS